MVIGNANEENSFDIYTCFENCFVRKLAKNDDESEIHAEYDVRKFSSRENVTKLQNMLQKYDFNKKFNNRIDILSLLIILYIELESDGPWKCDNIACILNDSFISKYNIEIKDLLKKDSNFPAQEIFENCLEKLHLKLTPGDFKKYPSLVEVYCSIIFQFSEYKLNDVNPLKILPAALLLIDDYKPCNKKKGLKCCDAVLSRLTWEDLKNSNYYEVIYQYLKKLFSGKDLEITRLVSECMKKLLNSLNFEVKQSKMDEMLSSTLEEIYVESNFYRKTILFEFLEKLILDHQINCVRSKKKFDKVVLDNLDACVHREIRDKMLHNILQCTKTWIKYCWPLWKYEMDRELISVLLKVLYTTNTEETFYGSLQNLILTLIMLCSQEEKLEIVENINTSLDKFQNENESAKFLKIVEYINTMTA